MKGVADSRPALDRRAESAKAEPDAVFLFCYAGFVLFAIWMALAQLTGAAWTSGRPPGCADSDARSANVWERTKAPHLGRYCDFLADASSKLAGAAPMAAAALDLARQADAMFAGQAAPLVLEGRALCALGRLDDAVHVLELARSRDASALEEPRALFAWARVLARTGRAAEAAEAYRALLPRLSVLSPVERSAAEVEAGLVAMSRGAAGLDEAAAALREGMREARDETQEVAMLALALALDRRGDVGEARALLGERLHGDPRNVVASARGRDVLAVAPPEGGALAALALEANDAPGARDSWQRYLDSAPFGGWAEHARAHLAALGVKSAPPRSSVPASMGRPR
jgi:tetratricopeptide (TPR) repeat protein